MSTGAIQANLDTAAAAATLALVLTGTPITDSKANSVASSEPNGEGVLAEAFGSTSQSFRIGIFSRCSTVKTNIVA